LRGIDRHIGLTQTLADAFTDRRHASYIDHSLRDLLAQRIYQMACAYADGNGANALRTDPMFKLAPERRPLDADMGLLLVYSNGVLGAADAPGTAPSSGNLEEVIVTGSRIVMDTASAAIKQHPGDWPGSLPWLALQFAQHHGDQAQQDLVDKGQDIRDEQVHDEQHRRDQQQPGKPE
jgi:hypothetical protein